MDEYFMGFRVECFYEVTESYNVEEVILETAQLWVWLILKGTRNDFKIALAVIGGIFVKERT